MATFNRFDIVEAHYAFNMDYHEGQYSKSYKRLSKISKYFKPSPLFYGFESLSDNGKEIYQILFYRAKNEN